MRTTPNPTVIEWVHDTGLAHNERRDIDSDFITVRDFSHDGSTNFFTTQF